MKSKTTSRSAGTLPYPLHVRWSDEDQAWLGSAPGLTGECCHADSPEEALKQIKEIAEDLVRYLSKQGKTLPEVTSVSDDPDPRCIRLSLGLSQIGFSRALGISPKTLHKWEQGSSRPSGAARTLLRIAASDPVSVKRALAPR